MAIDLTLSNLIRTLRSVFYLGQGTTHYLKRDGDDVKLKDPNNAAERPLADLWEPESSRVKVPVISTPAVDRLDELISRLGSAGTKPGSYISDAGSQQINVAGGEGLIRTTDSPVGDLKSFEWSASSGISIPDASARYVGVEYNAGSPQVVVKTTDTWDDHTDFRLGSVVREGTTLHILNNPQIGANGVSAVYHRLYETEPLKRADRLGGLILSETGTRNLAVTAGEIYDGLNEFDISAIDTSGTDTFDAYYGSFTKVAGQTQWDNAQYDNAGTLTALGNNRWGVHWLYIEADGALVLIYGTVNAVSQAEAEASTAPASVPLRLQTHGKLIGRVVFQKDASSAAEVQSSFLVELSGTGVTNHNELGAIQGGTAGEYYHLTSAELAAMVQNAGTGTDERHPRFDGDGQTLQDGQLREDDSGNLALGTAVDTAIRLFLLTVATQSVGIRVQGSPDAGVLQNDILNAKASSTGNYCGIRWYCKDDGEVNQLVARVRSRLSTLTTGSEVSEIKVAQTIVGAIVDFLTVVNGEVTLTTPKADTTTHLIENSDSTTRQLRVRLHNNGADWYWANTGNECRFWEQDSVGGLVALFRLNKNSQELALESEQESTVHQLKNLKTASTANHIGYSLKLKDDGGNEHQAWQEVAYFSDIGNGTEDTKMTWSGWLNGSFLQMMGIDNARLKLEYGLLLNDRASASGAGGDPPAGYVLLWPDNGYSPVRLMMTTPDSVDHEVTAYMPGHLDGLKLSNNSTDSDHDIDISAGSCRDVDDTMNMKTTGVTTIAIDASGAGGLDTGTVTTNTFYSVWLIQKPDGTVNGLFSLSATAPTMPSGYTKKRRLGWVKTDGSSNIWAFNQFGNGRTRHVDWDIAPSNYRVLNDGGATTWTNVNLSSWVPETSRRVQLFATHESNGIPGYVVFREDGSSLNATAYTAYAATDGVRVTEAGNTFWMPCSSSQIVEYQNNTASEISSAWVVGWEDEL